MKLRISSLITAVIVLAQVGCARDALFSLSYATEEFLQDTQAQIDILWVVDNSQSMAANQRGIGQSFEAFISNLIESGVDYHIGVVSTDTQDAGRLHTGASGNTYIATDTIDPKGTFLQNIQVGIFGSAVERAFEAAALAVGKGPGWEPGDFAAPPNDGFLRTDASLFIIMVSDEDDKSFGPVTYYRKLFESYKGPGNEGLISVSAIVGPPGEGCFEASRGSAQPGKRYIDLASQTGGVFASICDDFSETLKELSISAAGLSARFELNGTPNLAAQIPCGDSTVPAAALCVKIDGTAVPPGDIRTGWTFDDTTNSVLFGVDSIPAPEAKITVKYQDIGR